MRRIGRRSNLSRTRVSRGSPSRRHKRPPTMTRRPASTSRPTSGHVQHDPQLLSYGKASCSYGRVRTYIRGGAGVLGY